jgi:hypothetical protein
MDNRPPKLIAINHDDYHAEYVGRTNDGKQFFLTSPFEPSMDEQEGREFLALYLFDAHGNLLEAKIDDLGPRAIMDRDKRVSLRDQRLAELGGLSFERIEIAPFSLDRFGSTFGLILREPEDDEDTWAVELQPGNFMAFFPPWDSGEYDT